MLRIYDVLPSYIGEISKRFNKEFCEGNLIQTEYDELKTIYDRLYELAKKCKTRKQKINDS